MAQEHGCETEWRGNRLTLITDPSSNLTTNTYDNNGNLTVSNANGTVTTNTWTYENRLRTVTLSGGAVSTGPGLKRQAAPAVLASAEAAFTLNQVVAALPYSTVTVLARLRGWSMCSPRRSAI